jgi:putative transcriptional regulator
VKISRKWGVAGRKRDNREGVESARVYRRRPPTEVERKSLNIGRLRQGGSRAKGSRVGDDLVGAFEEMARHLRGEIELEAHDLPGGAMTQAQIKAIRSKVASSTKEFERLFGIPARTMESYEQGRRSLDGAMRALLRIIDREPNAARRALAP